ncbi:MAG: hypothetical protein ACK462_02450 [Planctomyces sp.]|jgi:hypothetical protein
MLKSDLFPTASMAMAFSSHHASPRGFCWIRPSTDASIADNRAQAAERSACTVYAACNAPLRGGAMPNADPARRNYDIS